MWVYHCTSVPPAFSLTKILCFYFRVLILSYCLVKLFSCCPSLNEDIRKIFSNKDHILKIFHYTYFPL